MTDKLSKAHLDLKQNNLVIHPSLIVHLPVEKDKSQNYKAQFSPGPNMFLSYWGSTCRREWFWPLSQDSRKETPEEKGVENKRQEHYQFFWKNKELTRTEVTLGKVVVSCELD